MDFYCLIQKLQHIYEHNIVLITCGSFYIAIGEDAILLNKKLNLKLNCAKKGICKIGVPISSIEKYIKKLDELEYSYILLGYKKEQNKIIKISQKEGKNKEIYAFNNNCKTCNKNIYNYKTGYEQALEEYLKTEFGDNYIWD